MKPSESTIHGPVQKSSLELAVATREVHMARMDHLAQERSAAVKALIDILSVILLVAMIVTGIWWTAQPESRVNLDCPYTDKANPWRDCR